MCVRARGSVWELVFMNYLTETKKLFVLSFMTLLVFVVCFLSTSCLVSHIPRLTTHNTNLLNLIHQGLE